MEKLGCINICYYISYSICWQWYCSYGSLS